MQTATILVTGISGSGKTTFIQTLSDIPVTAKHLHLGVSKSRITLEVGRYQVDDDLTLQLFGTSGINRFEFAWDINYSRNLLGYVVMVDGRLPVKPEDTLPMLHLFQKSALAPYIVAVNWQNHPDAMPIEELRATFHQPETTRFTPCDAKDSASAKKVLLALMYEIFERLNNPVRR